MSSHNQNVQVQYVYHCCLCLILGKVYIVNFARNARSKVTQARLQIIHTMRLL